MSKNSIEKITGTNNLPAVFKDYGIKQITCNADTLKAPKLVCADLALSQVVKLNWDTLQTATDFKQYNIYRREDSSSNFVLVKTVTNFYTTVWFDSSMNGIKLKQYQYMMKSQNDCDVESEDSSTITLIFLKYEYITNKIIKLSWNRPLPGTDTVKYFILTAPFNQYTKKDSTTDTEYYIKLTKCTPFAAYSVKVQMAAYNNSCGSSSTALPVSIPSTFLITFKNEPLKNATVVNHNLVRLDLVLTQEATEDISAIVIRRAVKTPSGISTMPYDTFPFVKNKMEYTYYDTVVDAGNIIYYYFVEKLDSCGKQTLMGKKTIRLSKIFGLNSNNINYIWWKPLELSKDLQLYDIDSVEVQSYINGNWKTIHYANLDDTLFLDENAKCFLPSYYRILTKFQDADGSRHFSLSDSIELIPNNIAVLPPISIYNATIVNRGQIALQWQKSFHPKNNGYVIYRKLKNESNFKAIDTVVTDTFYIDNGLQTASESYCYAVSVLNFCNVESTLSQEVCTNLLTAENLLCKPQVKLKWQQSSFIQQNTDGYKILRFNGNGYDSIGNNLFSTEFTDSNVVEGNTYCYRISTYHSSGNFESFTDSLCVIPQIIAAPNRTSLIKATVTNTHSANGKILLEWQPIQHSHFGSYKIFHSHNNSGPFTEVGAETKITTTIFEHEFVNTKDSANYYYIQPFNVCNVDTIASEIHKVINLSAKAENLATVLNFTFYEGFEVQKYELLRREGFGVPQLITTLSANDSFFRDTGLKCNTIYSYQVRATSLNGNVLSFSDTASVFVKDTILPEPTNILAATVITTGINNGRADIYFHGINKNSRNGFVVYRSENNAAFLPLQFFAETRQGILTFTDEKLNTAKSNYAYYLRAQDSCGNLSEPSDTHRLILLNVIAEDGFNRLSWNLYSGFLWPEYKIEKRTAATAWHTIATYKDTTTFFEDFDVKCDTIYFYRIKAVSITDSVLSYSNVDSVESFENTLAQNPEILRATVTETGVSTGKILVEWQKSVSQDVEYYVLYRKTSNNSNWQQIKTIPATQFNTEDSQLNTYNQTYSYFIGTIDSCKNLNLDTIKRHTSIHLQATSGIEKIDVNWSAYKGFTVEGYELFRNNESIAKLPAFSYAFTDTLADCRYFNHYKIRALSTSGTYAESNLDSAESFDFNEADRPYVISVSVISDYHVQVQWAPVLRHDVAGYKVFRKNSGGGAAVLIKEINDAAITTFTDTFKVIDKPYCYQIATFDKCNNISPLGTNGCVILLSGNSQPGKNNLSWNDYIDWQNGTERFDIYKLSETLQWQKIGNTQGNNFTFSDTALSDDVIDFCYKIEAIENTGNFNGRAFSTSVCMQQPPVVWIPNSFSPRNSIYINDFFGPSGLYFNKYSMQVFNRWGQLIYETENSEKWNGKTVAGNFVQSGVYLYKITIYSFNGSSNTLTGMLTVID